MTSTRGANSCKREGSSPIPLGAQRRRKQRKRHDQREPPLAACAVCGQSPAGKQTPRSGWEDAGFSPPCLLQPTPTVRSGAAAAAGDRHCRDRALTRSGRDKGTSARLSFPSWARAQGQAVGTAPVPGLGAARAGFPSLLRSCGGGQTAPTSRPALWGERGHGPPTPAAPRGAPPQSYWG